MSVAPHRREGGIGAGTRRAAWPAVSIALMCVIAAIFAPAVPSFLDGCLVAMAGIAWLISRSSLHPDLLRVVAAFAIAIAVGAAGGIANDRYLFLKDGWYFCNPVLTIATGFVFHRCMPDLGRGLAAFVVGGALVSILHLLWFTLHPELLAFDASTIRMFAGRGYYVTILGVLILGATAGRWGSTLGLPRWLAGTCFLLCLASSVASFSRTMLLVFVLGAAALAGWLAKREWRALAGGALLLAVIVLGANGILALDRSLERSSFLGKIAASAQELQVSEFPDLRSVNENWRGFETARALDAYADGAPLQWIFGQGLGARVDLGFFQALDTDPRNRMRLIPVFHNGYAYLLIKTGLAGLALYLYVLWDLYRLGRARAAGPPGEADVLAGRLLQASVVAIAAATWVISGAFNKFDMYPFLLLTGFLVAALPPGTRSAGA